MSVRLRPAFSRDLPLLPSLHLPLVLPTSRQVELSGTSASTPVIAAMISLFNDARKAEGLPPMGHVAPFLYQTHAAHPTAFTDVSEGSIACLSGSPETVKPLVERPGLCGTASLALRSARGQRSELWQHWHRLCAS